MTEFAYSGLGLNPHYGTPRNPWGRMADGGGRIPGGSSSGAAVSVTDGMAVVAIGSDTGGSVRIPAALCGLTGFKPTARRVSTAGVLPLSSSLDSIGPLAASVRCCAIVDAAICAGHAPAMPQPRDLRSVRLLVPTTIVQDDMDDSVAAAFERACHVLEQAGATLTRAAMPELKQLADSNATRGTLAAAEAWAWHRALIEKDGHRYDPRVIARLRAGQAMSAADYIDLLRFRARWQASVAARLTGFDALLMPTTPIIAPGIAATAASDQAYSKANGLMLRNCAAINFLDGCALSLPCHKPGQAPVGLMLAGLPMHDAALIDIGLAAQAALH